MVNKRIKSAFSDVKKDIEGLNNRITSIEAKFGAILEKLDELLGEKKAETPKFKGLEPQNKITSHKKQESSIGNEGVHSFIHSTDIHSFNNHSIEIQQIKGGM